MTPTLRSEISKLSLVEKLALNQEIEAEIQAEIDSLGAPPGILHEDDPNLLAELDRRWKQAQEHPETCISLEELERRLALRAKSRE